MFLFWYEPHYKRTLLVTPGSNLCLPPCHQWDIPSSEQVGAHFSQGFHRAHDQALSPSLLSWLPSLPVIHCSWYEGKTSKHNRQQVPEGASLRLQSATGVHTALLGSGIAEALFCVPQPCLPSKLTPAGVPIINPKCERAARLLALFSRICFICTQVPTTFAFRHCPLWERQGRGCRVLSYCVTSSVRVVRSQGFMMYSSGQQLSEAMKSRYSRATDLRQS